MTPDEIIEVMQGLKTARKLQADCSGDKDFEDLDEAEYSVKSIVRLLSQGHAVRPAPLPDEITIPARVIPAPLRKAPKKGVAVYSPDPSRQGYADSGVWNGSEWCARMMERGLLYSDRETAAKVGKAMCPYA